MCSEFARATHVVRSWLVDTDYSLCCNLVSIDHKGVTRLHCRESNLPFELPLAAVALITFGVLVGLLVGCRQRHAKVVRSYPVYAEVEQPVAQQSDLILVRALLMCCGEKARAERRAVAERLRDRFGFQKSSCECQLHHLETLLVSHLSTSDGDMEVAIKNLHFSLLEQFERWLLHVSFRSTVTGGDHGVKTAVSNLSKKQKKQRVGWLLDDYEAVHRTWSQQTIDEMLQEVILYLLIWGEAGNLRFMPELLCFLFELAREYLLSPLEGEAVSDSDYLDNIVEPIYARIFHETFSSVVKGRPISLPESMLPEFPKNYDDFNECFWSLGAIATLRTRGANGMDSCPILAAPTGQRWKLLKDADWNAFFTNQSKTFREVRWWYCLLAANRRIILLHLVGFCLCFTVSLPEEWEFNGWGSLAVLPVACMIPTSVRVAGAFFDVWAMRTKFVRQTLKDSITTWLLTLVGSGLVLWLEAVFQYDVLTKSVEKYSTEAAVRTWLPVLMTVLTGFTFRELVLELLPAPAPPNDFDSNLFFESRTAALLHEPWFKHGHFWNLREEVLDVIRMYTFWILVWALKIVLAYTLLFPNIFDAHRAIDACFPHDQLVSLGESWLSLFSRPSYQIQLVLLVGLWTSSLIVFFTDTLLWYNCVTALWGGKLGIMRVLAARKVHSKNSSIKEAAMRKLRLQNSESWATIWKAIVTDLYQEDLISAAQRDELAAGDSEVLLKGKARSRCKEAFRRLHFLEYSFSDPNMPDSHGALRTPSLTVLIPHYAELLLVPASAFDLTMFQSAYSDTSSFSRLSSTDQLQPAKKSVHNVVAMLMAYFSHDWVRFVRRMLGEEERLQNATEASSFKRKKSKRVPDIDSATSTTGKNLLLAARQWASLRLQTMHRTVAGMMKNRLALKLLLRAELPDISKETLDQLVDAKYSCVAAMQRYHVMTDEEREDVEVMLNLWPSLVIAYIEEEKVDATYSRFYSCTIDGRCEKLPDGSRVPKHRVRLPGHPILGNGKSDNQNHAIIFCHGTVIQACKYFEPNPSPHAIDANQEGYLTESLKLSNAIQSFHVNMAGAWRGPAIVGFREHIFSNLGLMGEIAACSEAAFGTLVQRTMASVLWSRYHYGHPDMLDKCAMMAQGGISKATKGLNLSEDIFAGMDAMLRGHTVVHREFYEVGKGRDMGFLSILGFFSKLSMGTAQMSTSRQAYRLGTRLGLARLCGFYYAHIGYYVGQLHFYHASFSLFSLMFVGTLADQTGVLPLSAFGSTHVVKSVYNTLHVIFISASLLPLFMLLLAEHGWYVAITRPLRQLCSGSTYFFIFMSRCIAHFISGEFASGGAMYIPTGRGVATERQNFSILFSSFALPCLYPGAELAALLLLPYIMLPSLNLGWSFFSLAGLMPTSLLFAPLMFNPGCFKLKAQCADIRQWLHWLCDSGDKGWGGHHRALCARKKTVRPHSFLLPSKLMLLSFPIAVVAYGAMKPLGWDTRHMAILTLPIIPAAISAVLVVLCAAIRKEASTKTRCLIVPAAVLFAAAGAAEVAFVVYSQPRLPLAHWVALVSARYTAWRWVANSATYFCEVGGLVRDDVTSNSSRCERAFKRVGRFLRDVVVVGVAGHAWLVDAILGSALQSVALCLCFVPGLTWAHVFCLFETSTQSFKHSVDVHEEDVRSISRRLTRKARKQRKDELPADEDTHRRSGYMTERKFSARRVAQASMQMASRRRSTLPKNEPGDVGGDDDDAESDETLGNFATFLSVVAGEKQKPDDTVAASTNREMTRQAPRVAFDDRLEDVASGARTMKPLGALEA
ncbi:hypothetical protein AB1Y20_000824 [Prymnesium parvum]|uniref:1,3-beta-glucan synthase n=1 Tax=Prymnesium parvum TaxID=97485 RepID=A0AB34K6G3_PRYPA